MRLKKARRRFDTPEVTKPKRTDLNEAQFRVYNRIRTLPNSEILQAELRVLQGGVEGEKLIPVARKGATSFYDPVQVARFLGWSPETVEKYMYLYLRVVRRDDESAAEYRARKLGAAPESAPLLKNFERAPGVDPSKTVRLLSTRILVFLVLAPTYLKGGGQKALQDLRSDFEEVGLKSGRAKRILKGSSVVRWTLVEAGEVTL